MNRNLEVVTDPPPVREPTPQYVKWRNRAVACVIVFTVAAHGLVWFSTWSNRAGNSFMEICGIWLTMSGIAAIACTMTFVEAKDEWKREHRHKSYY